MGVEAVPTVAGSLIDCLLWSDEARYRLERMPPYVLVLVRSEAEDSVKAKGLRVITERLLAEARQGDTIGWEPEAERRLNNIPDPVRAMAKVELERTATERGEAKVTAALMEEVRARYFGLAGR